ncbi:MAG: hydrogenase [Bdellovibrionales bacterium GWB1_55_8]|nr:MAG: hydrogenase [Bdellovibrionales bacterium GWB1_55_8]
MSETRPLGGKIWTKPMKVLSVFAALGLFFIAKRFLLGIGAVSNMSDGYPWGIWIAYDVVVGTALACGGYSMALLIYVFNRGEFHHALRPALLTSMFGYTLAGVSVMFDIGRYWQSYNLFIPGRSQFNSVLFEIALCIALYTAVLWIEFSPSFLEKMREKGKLKLLNRVLFVFIALGVLLPTMHQSSLGTLLLIAGSKVSPLWHTSLMPLLFLTSAIAMGYAVVILESIISSISFRIPFETKMLGKIAGVVPYLVIVFLMVRIGDVVYRGQLGAIFNGSLNGFVFVLENVLYLASVVLLLPRSKRESKQRLFIAASCLLFAGAGYRFNTFLVGFDPGPGWSYFPSFSELSVSLGLVALEIMGYIVFVKKLPVLPGRSPARNVMKVVQ